MTSTPVKKSARPEARRLARLRAYEILDTPPERGFERITRLAARLFNVPITAITFLDEDRCWCKATYGLPKQEYARAGSFCEQTILSDAVLVVPDARADARFVNNDAVLGEEGVRFYAGAPLRTADGLRLGTLCVLDRVPRAFGDEDRALLADLAAMVVDELDLRQRAGRLHAELEGGRRKQSLLKRRQELLQRRSGTLATRVERRSAALVLANRTLRAEISRREKGEAALQHAKEEAEKANHAKSEFLSRMSHELRTPLNAILGFGQILQAQVPNDAHRDCTTHIVNAGRHLLGLINEVLDISRIEAGGVELALEPVRMAELVGETLDLIRPLADEHDIRVELIPKACVSEIVVADRQRFKQVLLNLVSNAVKYSPKGSRVMLDCQAVRPRRVRLCVHDAGPGIAPDKLDRLFVPFDRLGADKSSVQGTGLGLTLSKHLTEAMHGELGVESVPGQGSTFWVQLPRAEPADIPAHLRVRRASGRKNGAAAPEKTNGENGHHSNGSGYVYSNGNGHRYALSRQPSGPFSPFIDPGETRTLLYIEDNASNLSLVEHIMEERPQTRLLQATRGEEGLLLARDHRPDLILLDLHLPDIDGWEVLARLRRLRATRHTPVVAISADATRDTIDRLLFAGAYAYLTKPLNVDHFMHLLNTLRFPSAREAAAAAV